MISSITETKFSCSNNEVKARAVSIYVVDIFAYIQENTIS